MKYKISATVIRPGRLPAEWVRFSKVKMTKAECGKLLFRPKDAGKSFGDKIHLESFSCVRIDSGS